MFYMVVYDFHEIETDYSDPDNWDAPATLKERRHSTMITPRELPVDDFPEAARTAEKIWASEISQTGAGGFSIYDSDKRHVISFDRVELRLRAGRRGEEQS